MQVIVGTSVWSLALRRKNPAAAKETEFLKDLISDGRVVMLGAIRQEILSDIRHVEQFDKLRTALDAFPDELVTTADFIEAARISNRCRNSGIRTGNTDCLICSIAIARNFEIFSTDKDFQHMSNAVPISLFQKR